MNDATILDFPTQARLAHPSAQKVSDPVAIVPKTTEGTGMGTEAPRGPGVLSFSQMDEYDSCPAKYRYHRVDRLAKMETSGAALGGSSVHAVVERMEARYDELIAVEADDDLRDLFIEDFRARIEREVTEAAPLVFGGKATQNWPDGETQAWWESGDRDRDGNFKAGGAKMLVKYAALRRADERDGTSVIEFPCGACDKTGRVGEAECERCHGVGSKRGIEAKIRTDIEVPCLACGQSGKSTRDRRRKCPTCRGVGVVQHPIVGYVDSMVAVKNIPGRGLVRIVRDVKTGGSVLFLKPLQLVVYRKLIKLTYGWDVLIGQFLWLRGKDPTSQVREYDLEPYAEGFVESLYADHLKGIDAGIFPPRPSGLCGSCGYRAYCPWGSVQPEKGEADD